MKYSHQIIIDLPREKVVKLLIDPDNYTRWQSGLKKFEPLKGEAGQENFEAQMCFQAGKRPIDMRMKVVNSNLPDRLTYTFRTRGVTNIQENIFEEISPEQCSWTSINEFIFEGFMMKTMGFMMPGAFRKQSLKYMNDFKSFAENA